MLAYIDPLLIRSPPFLGLACVAKGSNHWSNWYPCDGSLVGGIFVFPLPVS